MERTAVSGRGGKSRKKTQSHDAKGFLSSPGNRKTLLLGLVLVVATIALYLPVHSYPFVNYDDELYVTYNDHVKAGLTLETVKWAFTSFDASNWHPLTWVSHALDYQVFHMDAGGHHETNLLLHVLNVLVLFCVLWRATGYAGRSFLVAGLFALHPLNVESVAWVAERKNLLSMLFFLLALGAYQWYARQPRVQRYVVVAALFALGLMAKPQVITLPFVLLLWDYWPLRRRSGIRVESSDQQTAAEALPPARSFSWLVMEKAPLFALSAASAVLTVKAQRAAGAMSGVSWQPFSIRLENAVIAYVRYIGKVFWPAHLALVYPHPGSSIRLWQVVASLLLLLAITASVIVNRRHRYLMVGWFWFLGTLVPMIGLMQVGVQAMADRYAYLSCIGLFLMVVWGVAEWADQRHVPVAWRAALSAAVLLALFVVARAQLDYWSDNVKLWTRVLEVTGKNWVAQNNLGHALLNQDREDEALPHFQDAVAINPADADSNLNIGAYDQRHKNMPAALERYEKVITLTQDNVRLTLPIRDQAFRNMGYVYLSQGDHVRARASFQQAVDLNPQDGEAWIGLGVMEQRLGEPNRAVDAYNHALRIQPFDLGYLLLARALQQAGREAEAQTAMQKAQQLSRNFQKAQIVADRLLAQ